MRLAVNAAWLHLNRVEADSRHALGDFYNDGQQQSVAIEQYILAHAIYKNFSVAEYPERQGHTYNLGLLFYRYEDYAQAIKYLREAMSLLQATRYNMFFPIANTIGLSYRKLKMYDSAIFYFQRVHDTAATEKHNYKLWVSISQGNIGITYFLQKQYAKAEPLLKEDIKVSMANTNLKNGVYSMAILATIYYEQKKYADAEKLIRQALTVCYLKSFWHDYSIAEKLYEQLYKIYEAEGKYQLANTYADSALRAKDSAIINYNALTLSKSYERQGYIKRKLAAENLEAQATLENIELDKRRMVQQQLIYKFIIGFLIVLIIVALVVNRYRGSLRKISTDVHDAPEIVLQKMSIVIISIATCAAAVVWAWLYYYYYGLRLPTFGPILYFLIVGPALIIYFIFKKQQLLVNVQLFCIFTMPVMMQYTGGGFKSGVVIDWAFLAPIGALMYKGIRHAAYWMVLLIVAVLCTFVFNGYLSQFYYPISETAQSMFYGMNIIGPSIIIYFSMQFFVKSVIRNGILLRKNNEILSNTLGELKLEKQKSDDLLLNILPGEVADELKEKGYTTAQHYNNVTVLFTDFVNFTSAGETMSPQGLVDELHTCFKAFDEIIGKYNIEKIKTVGDAYLAAAGVPVKDANHAIHVVKAAIEINQFMHHRRTQMGNDTFEVRLGIHSGNVVAGVVGMKKFAYDIWGDAVNVASRMESSSEPGRINISGATYGLVKNYFMCEYRGQIPAKNKGVIDMYFVNGEA